MHVRYTPIDPYQRDSVSKPVLSKLQMINSKSQYQQIQHGDAKASNSCCRRRIIFPIIHEKCSAITNPVIFSGKKLSDHIEIYTKALTLTSSVDSDLPSLTSLSTVSDCTSVSIPSIHGDKGCSNKDESNLDAFTTRKAVRFDPRIWVHEFDRTDAVKKALWFTAQDLNTFKFGAMQCILAYKSRVPNVMNKNNSRPIGRKQASSVLFSHPALGMDNEYDDNEAGTHHIETDLIRFGTTNSPSAGTIATRNSIVNQFREAVAENEIQNILVVDPQEICLKLYAKGLQRMFPNASIVTSRNKEEALHHVYVLSSKKKSGNDFDVLVYDEPKSSTHLDSSGVTLFEHLKECSKTPCLNIIVVSDRNAASQSRNIPETDLRWTKPPPSMNDDLRDLMLKTLLLKRGRNDIANKIFS